MNIALKPHQFSRKVRIPGSKSHTIRQLLIAALAAGESRLRHPLESLDAASCLRVCRTLGSNIEEIREGGALLEYRVTGAGAEFSYPHAPLDVGNSGTTLFLALSIAGLGNMPLTFTGDEQIRRRSAKPLLNALQNYGVQVSSGNGCAPITVCGPWRGGRASIECPTSQYLTALLLAAPLAPQGVVTEIDVPLLYEKPYIEMTLSYLRRQNIRVEHKKDFSFFSIEGGQRYSAFESEVPADFSSAAFPALAAVVSGGETVLCGLDPEDAQGDKAFFSMLAAMGADVLWQKTGSGWTLSVKRGRALTGGTFDLNDTPDMLPAACVLAAFARSETALVNVENARIKETDRIAVMALELTKLGVRCRELPDGIVIEGNPDGILIEGSGTDAAVTLDGHGDHRVVMALACAALGASAPCMILGAEAADVTYPGFLDLLKGD
ncbi:MAG: 3-phosphoshikimate 1-carboxyvinyltransferase [Spirochaetaceae bacterium]|nr:3-phosphoshikimate 1-carboxyvinyltransferase [Spirochaetaceae bacterium]